MVQRVDKHSDLIIELIDVDLESLRELNLEYYTENAESPFVVNKDELDVKKEGVFVNIPSNEVSKFPDGLLKCSVKYKLSNSKFPDGTYDKILKQNLGVWLN